MDPPVLWTEMYNHTKMMEHSRVRKKLIKKPGEFRVLNPEESFLRSAAFFFSAEVREIAPMDSSVEKKATRNFLMIVYHAVYLFSSWRFGWEGEKWGISDMRRIVFQ